MKHDVLFSNRENKIIKIIGRKKITLAEISDDLFEGDSPLDGVILVSSSVRRIIRKCEYYSLDWTITRKRENKKLIIRREKM